MSELSSSSSESIDSCNVSESIDSCSETEIGTSDAVDLSPETAAQSYLESTGEIPNSFEGEMAQNVEHSITNPPQEVEPMSLSDALDQLADKVAEQLPETLGDVVRDAVPDEPNPNNAGENNNIYKDESHFSNPYQANDSTPSTPINYTKEF